MSGEAEVEPTVVGSIVVSALVPGELFLIAEDIQQSFPIEGLLAMSDGTVRWGRTTSPK